MNFKEAFINRKKELTDKFISIAKDITVSNEEYTDRINLCQNCDNYIRLTHQCRECGCIMNVKARLSAASCPIKKW
jgi:hypothetical protein